MRQKKLFLERKKISRFLSLIVAVLVIGVSGCSTPATDPKDTESAANIVTNLQNTEGEDNAAAGLPAYMGDAYVVINNNIPFFTEEEMSETSYESYGALDSLGRCTMCVASVGTDLMPTEERGSIGSVKPTGWHTIKYDFVDGKYLYNRCHLIGYQLTAENANEKNLITGTRYLNIEGMLPFENMVGDYVRETKNHVMYRVTPVFTGDNLLADGVLMEGKSVEDNGEGILFCVFAYNVQPGVIIDYATGESREADRALDENNTQNNDTANDGTSSGADTGQTKEATYILNTGTRKFHRPECESVKTIKQDNYAEFTGNREELISSGYDPCKNCNP